jgi:sugar-specific transcriptional regulator TrmB
LTRPADHVEILAQLGLTSNETKIFWTLCQMGPATAKTISKSTGVAREIIYQIMPKLQEKGLIEVMITTPKKFRAIPMNKSLGLLLKSKTEEYKKLEVKVDLLSRAFKGNDSNEGLQTEDSSFVLIPERESVVKRINEAIEVAERSIDLVLSWKRFSQGTASVFAESIKSALNKNVKVRFVVENPGKAKSANYAFQFCRKSPTCQTKFIPNRPQTVLGIYDEKELFVIANPQKDLYGSPALWTNNQSLISLVQDFFDILWITAMENPNYQAIDVGSLDIKTKNLPQVE